MTDHLVKLRQEVAAPPEHVWQVLTDLAGAAEVLSSVSRIEMLTAGPYGVGTRWRETRRMMGREETQEMWVSECHEPHSTVVSAASGGVAYRTVFTLAPVPAGTMLVMEFGGSAEAPSAVQRLLWGLFAWLGVRLTKRVMAADLRDIAGAAERGHA